MEVTEPLRARRSIRKYKSGAEIPQQDIDLILEAAMIASSAEDSRPWEFVVIKSSLFVDWSEAVKLHKTSLQ